MGVAAYNRGTMKIARDLQCDRRHEFEIMERLDSYPKGERWLVCRTVIRISERGKWWLMNREDRGWGECGIRYDSAKELFADWNIVVVGCRRDKHSFLYDVENV